MPKFLFYFFTDVYINILAVQSYERFLSQKFGDIHQWMQLGLALMSAGKYHIAIGRAGRKGSGRKKGESGRNNGSAGEMGRVGGNGRVCVCVSVGVVRHCKLFSKSINRRAFNILVECLARDPKNPVILLLATKLCINNLDQVCRLWVYVLSLKK